MKRTGGGRFDPTDRPIFFPATKPDQIEMNEETAPPFALIATNELTSTAAVDGLRRVIDRGVSVFLDSGIYWLTNRHARAHGVSMNDALMLPPEQVDGFDELFGLYCRLIEEYEDDLWGYIELDQGGMENKRRTRAVLEGRGLRPIPVYHPINDGWDYFDELAKEYDRICFGNLVKARSLERKRLMATAFERSREYPHLWVHLLGVYPIEWFSAMPAASADSSSWQSCVRYTAGPSDRSMLKTLGPMHLGYRYVYGSDSREETGDKKGLGFGMALAVGHHYAWRAEARRMA